MIQMKKKLVSSLLAFQDKIFIKGIKAKGIIGVNPWERNKKQELIVSLTLYTNTKKVAETDTLKEGVNYETICNDVIQLIENSSYYLVETLAENIAALCLTYYPIKQVIVTLEKPQALKQAQTVGVEITRKQNDFDT